jgi:hypothetical protein
VNPARDIEQPTQRRSAGIDVSNGGRFGVRDASL